MASPVIDAALVPQHITAANTLVKTGNGVLRRVVCASSSSGTLTVYDGTSASGALIINAFPLTAGNSYQFDALVQAGLYVVLGGTADITLLYL